MYILQAERPQNVNYTNAIYLCIGEEKVIKSVSLDDCNICIKCKHSVPNFSFPKDEMECSKTGGICNALCVCDKFEEDV